MKMIFLGGADEIGASCLLLEIAGKTLLIDAGLRPKTSGPAALPDLDKITKAPDAILLTHAHIDHIGSIPVVHQRFPDVPVFTSEPTAALMKVMLMDSAHLQSILSETPLYNRNDVNWTMRQISTLLMERWYYLTDSIALSLVPAGHLLGAVSILLDTAEGRIVISGDVSITHQRAINGLAAPPFAADILIMEATYGDSLHPPRDEEERRLAQSVTEVITDGGIALIPSFALGRAQEVILTLRQAQLAQHIPIYPIYVDGLVRSVTDIYYRQLRYLSSVLQTQDANPFWSKGRIVRVKAGQRDLPLQRPGCIVSSSGMLLGGPSVFYARKLMSQPENAIFITGYTDEESPGRKLQNLQRGDNLRLEGRYYPVECQVRRFGLSGHADAQQLALLGEHFAPRQTFLVHGEAKGRQGLKERMPQPDRVYLPRNGEEIDIPPPHWLMRQPPYLLDMGHRTKSVAVEAVIPLGGERVESLPKLKVKQPIKIIEEARVQENIPTPFPCITCGGLKNVTIDLQRRQIVWRCSQCDHTYETSIMNLKQKDIKNLSDPEQRILIDFIYVSLLLQEPVVGRDWRDMAAQPEKWQHWLNFQPLATATD